MIEVSEAAEELLPRIDGILFDIDGVLIDISQSIRQVCCVSVPFYLREVLGWAAGDEILTSADIELFKNAGGFNDDTDLICAIVLQYLVKEHENPGATAETLNVFQPSFTRYAARIAERGGGLKAAEQMAFEHLTNDDRTALQMDYRKQVIKRIFLEMFAGKQCPDAYGVTPEYYHGEGYWKFDRPLIELDRLSAATAGIPAKKLGILTGRTSGETRMALEVTGLTSAIPASHIVTADDGSLKPDPVGLRRLVKHTGVTAGIYIGDTRDDFRTVQNYRTTYPTAPPILGALVLTGPMGDANAKIFRRSQADIVASDVNEVLRWLAGEKA